MLRTTGTRIMATIFFKETSVSHGFKNSSYNIRNIEFTQLALRCYENIPYEEMEEEDFLLLIQFNKAAGYTNIHHHHMADHHFDTALPYRKKVVELLLKLKKLNSIDVEHELAVAYFRLAFAYSEKSHKVSTNDFENKTDVKKTILTPAEVEEIDLINAEKEINQAIKILKKNPNNHSEKFIFSADAEKSDAPFDVNHFPVSSEKNTHITLFDCYELACCIHLKQKNLVAACQNYQLCVNFPKYAKTNDKEILEHFHNRIESLQFSFYSLIKSNQELFFCAVEQITIDQSTISEYTKLVNDKNEKITKLEDTVKLLNAQVAALKQEAEVNKAISKSNVKVKKTPLLSLSKFKKEKPKISNHSEVKKTSDKTYTG